MTAPLTFGRMHVLPAVCRFLKECPLIDVGLELSDAVIDLQADDFDLGVRIGPIAAPSLITRRVGGGKVFSFPNAIRGSDRLIRLFQSLSRKYSAQMEYLAPATIDGLPGFISRIDGPPQTTTLEIVEGQIVAIYITRNPDKLTGLALH